MEVAVPETSDTINSTVMSAAFIRAALFISCEKVDGHRPHDHQHTGDRQNDEAFTVDRSD
jgi:hypothetical protein